MTSAAQGLVDYALTALDWFFLLLCTFFVVFMAFMAFSRYGEIKLGADDEEPEFATGSWVAMLFAAGMGSGLLFWGVAEPVYHFAQPPGGLEPSTAESARQAFVITNFHWGLHAWSIYGCCALVVAYFTFRLNLPSMISTPILVGFRNVFNRRALHGLGTTADVLAVVAVVFGLAGSLASGALMVRSGLSAVFGTDPDSDAISYAILATLTVCFLLSASTGVDKGIKILSNINIVTAVVILLVVLFGGPTAYLFQVFVNSFGDYLIGISADVVQDLQLPAGFLLELVPRLDVDVPDLVAGVGAVRRHLHRARISRGRTIREFVIYVVGVPTIASMLWFAGFGGSAVHIELFGSGGLADQVFADVSAALFAFFEYFPATTLLSTLLGAAAVRLPDHQRRLGHVRDQHDDERRGAEPGGAHQAHLGPDHLGDHLRHAQHRQHRRGPRDGHHRRDPVLGDRDAPDGGVRARDPDRPDDRSPPHDGRDAARSDARGRRRAAGRR